MRLWALASLTCLRSINTLDPEDGASFDMMGQLERLAKCPVLSVRFAGGVLITGGSNGNIKLWSLAGEEAAECVATFKHGSSVRGLAVMPKGLVASVAGKASKDLLVWRPAERPAG